MTPINGLGIGTSKFTFIEPVTNNYSVDLDGTEDFVNFGNSSGLMLIIRLDTSFTPSTKNWDNSSFVGVVPTDKDVIPSICVLKSAI